ncbi:MAG: lysylphosphatidylglycerol synthase transmembrane domain-containing protein, partial [Burkholderiales bacterium]
MKYFSTTARTLVLVILNIAIFIFIGKWLYENIRPTVLLAHIRELSPLTTLEVVAINILVVAVYGKRMASLLRRDFLTSWYIVNLGFGLNSVLPFRLGEPAKIYHAYRYFDLSPVQLATATFIEKFLDLSIVAVLLAFTIAFSTQRILDPALLWWTTAVLAAASIVILTFNKGVTALEKLVTGTGKLSALVQNVREFSHSYPLLPVLTATAMIWGLNLAVVYFAFNAFLPATTVGLIDAVTLMLICVLSVAIPAAPAGLGLFEAGIVAYLTQFLRVPQEQALAAAVVFHLAVILPQLAIMLTVIARYSHKKRGHNDLLAGAKWSTALG